MPLRLPRSRPARLALSAAALAVAGLLALAALWLTLPDPADLARRNPPTTALIEQRKAEAARRKVRYRPVQSWVPLERISRRLVEAVVASEDAKFFDHGGFDWEALRDAARHDLAQGRFARGASTISQQTAKNLWLGTEKSLLRKVREAVATAKLERALDKRRILAIYLNVAEWGVGVFGVEAGARHHLGVGAGSLSTAQAVLLASMLPAPRRVDLRRPAPWLAWRATHLLDRLHAERRLSDDEHRSASAELARLLGAAPREAPEDVPPDDDEVPPAAANGAPSPAPAAAPAAAEGPPPPEPQGSTESGGSTPGQADSAPPEQGSAKPQE